MKKILVLLFIGFASLHASAQEANKSEEYKKTPEQRMEMRLNHMKTELKLTSEQEAKVKAAMEAQRTKSEEARQNNHTAFDSELKTILSEEQYKKWKTIHEDKRNHHRAAPGPHPKESK